MSIESNPVQESIETNDKFYQDLKNEMNKMDVNVSNVKHLGLYILKYTDKKDFGDPRKKFCRGLILEAGTGMPICVPPEKSMNFANFLQLIGDDEWKDVVIEAFPDGTMINVFNYDGKWNISTRSKIGAHCRFFGNKFFNEMFDEAAGFLDYKLLNPDLTYSFVLQHPDNRIVTKFKKAGIVLVQVRKQYEIIPLEGIVSELKEKGLELSIPEVYVHHNLESVIKQLTDMPFGEQGLVFKYNGVRSKLRNEKYSHVKILHGNNWNEIHTYLEARQTGKVKQLLVYYPEYQEQFNEWNEDIKKMTGSLYHCYINRFVHKTIDWKMIPFELRTHVSEIHEKFKEEKTKETAYYNKYRKPVDQKFRVNFDFVKNHFNNLPIKRIIWIVNFKKNYSNEEGYFASKQKQVEEEISELSVTEQVPTETVIVETPNAVEDIVNEK
tara:strand:+ start:101 stop:1414 length:1314 start_codon:yes stop_codon:yes gene_type:complete